MAWLRDERGRRARAGHHLYLDVFVNQENNGPGWPKAPMHTGAASERRADLEVKLLLGKIEE
jgi:hypothetical protein